MLSMLLSPAKKLHPSPLPAGLTPTRPLFPQQTKALVEQLLPLSPLELGQMLKISTALAHKAWQYLHAPAAATPAAMLFKGDTYVGLDALSLSADDLAWAQDHLFILSGLHGLLRPLDQIPPYRLEMGTRLPQGQTLQRFWQPIITRFLAQELAQREDPTVVNLASEEYAKAVDVQALGCPFLHVVFQEVRDGRPQVIGILAKRARGMMARYVIQGRITHPLPLQAFQEDSYRFDEQASREGCWVFGRVGR